MNECLFCRIIAKEMPAEIVYEDSEVVAFLDIKPVNHGHVLVVPKAHAADFASADASSLAAVALSAQRIGKALMQGLGAPGFNLIVNNGRAAGQLVGHLHVHLIPRFEGDGHAPWHGEPYKEGEMAEVGQKLKRVLA